MGRAASTRKPAPARMAAPRTESLLVELLTEELPPKALRTLSEAFERSMRDLLRDEYLLTQQSRSAVFATPRRLAVRFTRVLARQPNRLSERMGPKQSAPSQAIEGFARSCGVAAGKLQLKDGRYCYSVQVPGRPVAELVPDIVARALKTLPVPKLMRWGSGDAQFVRPVHGLVLLYGARVVPGAVLGIKSGRKTLGHRFLSRGALTIAHADKYETTLARRGMVIAGFEHRRQMIETQLEANSKTLSKSVTWRLERHAELMDEVTSLVEYPVVYRGQYEPAFLDLPKECLVIAMQRHQKYFPLANAQGELLPQFLMVSNIRSRTPRQIIHGNERVLKARLSDARFFFEQDRKVRLAERVPRLANVVFHNKLGSQLERVERIRKLAREIAERLAHPKIQWLTSGDVPAIERAAYLCKADLLTQMVGEFPELQGTMGKYYAAPDEPKPVAEAIEEHYMPKSGGGELPRSRLAVCVALADKLDMLVGIYGIGLVPTGDKDPFGLRRLALGAIRILAEHRLPLDALDLLHFACALYDGVKVPEQSVHGLYAFMLERLKSYLREQGFAVDEIEAVVSLNPTRIDQVPARMRALREFRALPEAEALASANKRIHNILKQADGTESLTGPNPELLHAEAEQQLAQRLAEVARLVQPLFDAGDYAPALQQLARLREPVDRFFDDVMVMVDDEALRAARLALLSQIRNLFLHVADISRLQN